MTPPGGAAQPKRHAAFPPPRPSALRVLTRPPIALPLLAVLTVLLYSNTFSVPFLFDDNFNISENPWVKDPRNLLDLSGSRYVGYLTFALNYQLGGLHVWGYHVVNLLIHLANVFLVFALIRLLLKSDAGAAPSFRENGLALAGALLFAVHPIQTQAVTYIVQRLASLAALFYLLTVVAYLKWRLSSSATPHSRLPTPYLWYALALLAAVLGMKTKENTFTLPFMLALLEWAVPRTADRKRWIALIPFFFMLLIIPFSRLDVHTGLEGGLLQQTGQIGRWDYLLTESRVIVTYLRLLILPVHQNLDYDYPVYHSLLDPPVLASFVFVTCLLLLPVYLLWRGNLPFRARLVAFGILGFFLTLSVESSLVPIQDVIFEHRLYLPSALIFTAAVVTADWAIDRLQTPGWIKPLALILVAAALSMATVERNAVWGNEKTLWEDVIAKSPRKVRGYHGLAAAFVSRKQWPEALAVLRKAIELDPDDAGSYNNLGIALQGSGRTEEAIDAYQRAVRLDPKFARAHYNLGGLYKKLGRTEDSIREYREAIKLDPDFPGAHNNLGNIFLGSGRLNEALREFQEELKRNPADPIAHNNLGNVYGKQGNLRAAIGEFQAAVKLDPGYANAYFNLGNAYGLTERFSEAITAYQSAIRLAPRMAAAHYNLASIYSKTGNEEEADSHFKTAFEIDPGLKPAAKAKNGTSDP
jgi:tetratricopeptide (TPR) repeat protein